MFILGKVRDMAMANYENAAMQMGIDSEIAGTLQAQPAPQNQNMIPSPSVSTQMPAPSAYTPARHGFAKLQVVLADHIYAATTPPQRSFKKRGRSRGGMSRKGTSSKRAAGQVSGAMGLDRPIACKTST